MTRPGASLRGRMTLSMILVLLGGLGVVAGLHALEEDGHGLGSRLSRLLLGDELPEPWQDLAVLLPFALLIPLFVNVVCAWSLRPLLRASAEAARIGPSDPSARIHADGLPAELSPLVGAVNGALDRLARAYEAERRFTVNAAHELRTPLATLSLRLQRVQLDAAAFDWPAIERDIAAMTGRIDQLLTLARAEGIRGGAAELQVLDLRRPAREAAAQVWPLAERSARDLVVDMPEPLLVRGTSAALQDMVRNLIENALHHGCGRIEVRGENTTQDGTRLTLLTVSDEGVGPPAELRKLLFERFRKGQQNTHGSGLGLTIVQEIASQHGGKAEFLQTPLCTVAVTLPAAPNASSVSPQVSDKGLTGRIVASRSERQKS